MLAGKIKTHLRRRGERLHNYPGEAAQSLTLQRRYGAEASAPNVERRVLRFPSEVSTPGYASLPAPQFYFCFGSIRIETEADAAGSASEVAVTVTKGGLGTALGAEYKPSTCAATRARATRARNAPFQSCLKVSSHSSQYRFRTANRNRETTPRKPDVDLCAAFCCGGQRARLVRVLVKMKTQGQILPVERIRQWQKRTGIAYCTPSSAI